MRFEHVQDERESFEALQNTCERSCLNTGYSVPTPCNKQIELCDVSLIVLFSPLKNFSSVFMVRNLKIIPYICAFF